MVLMVRPPEFHQHHPKPKNSSTSKTYKNIKTKSSDRGQTSRRGTIIDLGPVRVSGKICLGQKSQAFGRSAWHLSWRDHWDMRKFGKRCWNRPGRLQVWPSQPFPARELIWWKKIPWYRYIADFVLTEMGDFALLCWSTRAVYQLLLQGTSAARHVVARTCCTVHALSHT